MAWNLHPKTIEGRSVRLEPLTPELFEPLCDCLLGEPDGWFSTMFGFNSRDSISILIQACIKANEDRKALTFVSRDLKTMKVAGVSNFMRIDERNRQLEIGSTQVGKAFRRSNVNTETKFLMLSEAFENLKAVRVYFKVDAGNMVSRNAILRIGAIFEGIARNDCILPSGEKRDFCIYSITDSEWPKVKENLVLLVERNSSPLIRQDSCEVC